MKTYSARVSANFTVKRRTQTIKTLKTKTNKMREKGVVFKACTGIIYTGLLRKDATWKTRGVHTLIIIKVAAENKKLQEGN